MSNFALIEIETVKGRQKFYKLVKDGTCEFDEFEAEARENFDTEMKKIYLRMDALAIGRRLPKIQFRILKGGINNLTECEIKTKNLRVYYFIDKTTGNIIITGGHKTKQKKDINRFRGIVKKYLESKGNRI